MPTVGIGPNQSSLLGKLGFKQAYEMSDDELYEIVAKDQKRRTIERALGRAQRATVEENDDGTYQLRKTKSPGRPRTKSRVKKSSSASQTLESLGLNPDLCQRLRATGKPDWQLILELQGAGIL